MKKIIITFFAILGVIFFLLILVGVYFFVTDPLGLKPLFLDTAPAPASSSGSEVVDKNPVLSPAQEKVLETVGIDPAAVPTSITPEQEACFKEVLGEVRVAEIIDGATPSPLELLQGKRCIE